MKLQVFFRLLLILGSCNVQAQNLTIKGYVMDSGVPIQNGTLIFTPTNSKIVSGFAISNEKGYFEIRLDSNSLPGTLRGRHIGYKEFQMPIPTFHNFGKPIYISLQKVSAILDTVKIIGKLPIKLLGDTTRFLVDSFKTGLDNNLGELLSKMPGFSILENGRISFNGKSVSRILFQYDDLHGKSYEQIIKSLGVKQLEEIEVIDNYVSSDDILADNLMSRETVINLNFSKNANLKLSGENDLSAGTPVPTVNLKQQLLGLKPKLKTLFLLAWNNSGEAKALYNSELLVVPESVVNDLDASNYPSPLIDNKPSGILGTRLPVFNRQQTLMANGSSIFRLPHGWMLKYKTSYVQEKISQLQQRETVFFNDSIKPLNLSDSLQFRYACLNQDLKIIKLFNPKFQLIGQATFAIGSNNFTGNSSFQQLIAQNKSFFHSNQFSSSVIINFKPTSKVSHRWQLGFSGNKHNATATFLNQPFSLLFFSQNAEWPIEQIDRFNTKQFFLNYQQAWSRPNSRSLLRIYTSFQQLYWNNIIYPKEYPAMQIREDSLLQEAQKWIQWMAEYSREITVNKKISLQLSGKLLWLQGYQNEAALSQFHLSKLFYLANFQFQWKISSHAHLILQANNAPAKTELPTQGFGLYFTNVFNYSETNLPISSAYSKMLSVHYSNFRLSNRKHSWLLMMQYAKVPMFNLANLNIGQTGNFTQHLALNSNIDQIMSIIQVQSPVLQSTLKYSFALNYFNYSNNGGLNGTNYRSNLHSLSFICQGSVKIKTHFQIGIKNKFSSYIQNTTLPGASAGFGLQNLLELKVSIIDFEKWNAYSEIIWYATKTLPNGSIGSLPLFNAYVSRSVCKIQVFLKGQNLTNKTLFQTNMVSTISANNSQLPLLNRQILVGIKFNF